MTTVCECEVDNRPRWKKIGEGLMLACIGILAAVGAVVVGGGALLWWVTR